MPEPPASRTPNLRLVETVGPAPASARNRLYHADNLACLTHLTAAKIRPDLIYIDPPFGLQQDFKLGKGPTPMRKKGARKTETAVAPDATAYSDVWPGGIDGYLAMLEPRLAAMHALLADDGSFYIHLDSTVVHYVKVLLDRIFTPACFQREIIWRIGWISGYKSRAKNWIRNHDTILFYTKHPTRFYFAKQIVPHPAGYRRRAGNHPATVGIPVDDVWNANAAEAELTGEASLDSIQIKSFSREKTGYPTQKNLSLLKRILAASSAPDDLVADFFCGSGTTPVAAAQMDRRFVGSDVGIQAIKTVQSRLAQQTPAAGYGLWRAE
ncbi:MAG TPA: site-specific DNA-methyltransferase [Planctomycetota bacterium]|nr:site-specific DNA-methyltransferase [Planctomycetota bacterium]